MKQAPLRNLFLFCHGFHLAVREPCHENVAGVNLVRVPEGLSAFAGGEAVAFGEDALRVGGLDALFHEREPGFFKCEYFLRADRETVAVAVNAPLFFFEKAEGGF